MWKCSRQTQTQFITLLVCQNFKPLSSIWKIRLKFTSLAFRAFHRPACSLSEETWCSSPFHCPRQALHIPASAVSSYHPLLLYTLYSLPPPSTTLLPRNSESWPICKARVYSDYSGLLFCCFSKSVSPLAAMLLGKLALPEHPSVGSPIFFGLHSKVMPLLWLLPHLQS